MNVREHFVSPLAVMFVVVDDADEALNSDSAEMGMLTCLRRHFGPVSHPAAVVLILVQGTGNPELEFMRPPGSLNLNKEFLVLHKQLSCHWGLNSR